MLVELQNEVFDDALSFIDMASADLIRQASSSGRRRYSAARAREELQPLLDEENGDSQRNAQDTGGTCTPRAPRDPNVFCDLPVFQNIWRIRREIISSIADPYTLEQLRAPRLNTTVVRPLMAQLYNLQDISIVYSLLVNRVQFLRDQSYQAHYLSVNTARALLCELLAIKILRQYDEDSAGQKGLLLLSNILIAGFDPFQGCPDENTKTQNRPLRWLFRDKGEYEHHSTALEVAIISDSKLFLSSPACQKVVDAIYVGRIVYTPTSFIDIIPDHYKHKSITIYNPRKAPLLNQYRLAVPRTRNFLEVGQFIVLLILFFIVMSTRRSLHFTPAETIFCIYTFGWILDQLASVLEHGWRVYSENLWSFLDVTFAAIYIVYFGLRVHGIQTGTVETSQPALDILAMGAPFLIPRLAFNLFSENLLFVSLREMMARFLMLTMLAVWSFLGFFLSMYWLSEGRHKPFTIGKWMVWVWFGLDGTGIQRSSEFHWLLGPTLMIAFAVLGNTLFLTILVSTLSNTFARITRHSTSEIQFRRAVLTFEGVKADAVFSYQPPFNLLAVGILVPLKLCLSGRWFHKLNITAVRIINFPLLIAISLYERRNLWPTPTPFARRADRYPHRTATSAQVGFGDFSRFHVHGDLKKVFECEPPSSTDDGGNAGSHLQFEEPTHLLERDKDRSLSAPILGEGAEFLVPPRRSSGGSPAANGPKRRTSVWSMGGSVGGVTDDQQHPGAYWGDHDHDHDHAVGHGHGHKGGGEGLYARLEKLEATTSRIEGMLTRLTEVMEGPTGEEDQSGD